MSNSKPVVFLAFADSAEANLPRLADELRQVRAALAPAINHGWCDVVERANVTLDDILDVFRQYRDRVTLFHYGGHATSYQLLLNASAGTLGEGKLGEINAGGLAEFLSQQRNLTLVFLNGCSSARQVDALLDAGVGAVIATSEDIRDDAAVEIAAHFYRGLGEGQPLQTSYNEAVAAMRAKHGEDVATDTPWQLRIRPDGKSIVSTSADQSLKLWDAANGNELRTLNGHNGSVWSATFSPDGKSIVSASADQTLKLWDATTGNELRTLNDHNGSVWSAVFSPDGKSIVSTSSDGTVRIWVASIEDLLQMAEARIQRRCMN